MRVHVLALAVTLAGPASADLCDLVGHWEGSLTHEDQRYPVKLDVSCHAESHRVTLDFPEYLIYGSAVDVDDGGQRLIMTPRMAGQARIEVRLEGGRLVGECQRLCDVTSEVVLEQVTDAAVEYVDHDVAFRSGDAELKGTLLQPPGNGPFPTIVWTHGSGRDTRETFYYSGRAHLMAQHGVASLIYDKRGAGESTGTRSYDLNVLIEDALVAVETIRSRTDVAGIGIAGFSQGGWIAPAVAAQDPSVDFVVVGATPGVTGAEQNIYSMASRMRRDGEPEATVEAAERFIRQLYAFYETGESRDAMVNSLESAKSEKWFESKWVANITHIPSDGLPHGPSSGWAPFFIDPVDSWRRVTVPVLSMWGAEDIDVPVTLSRERIRGALTETGNADFRLEVFQNASHGMWTVRDEGSSWDWPRQVEGAHALMVSWILEHVSP